MRWCGFVLASLFVLGVLPACEQSAGSGRLPDVTNDVASHLSAYDEQCVDNVGLNDVPYIPCSCSCGRCDGPSCVSEVCDDQDCLDSGAEVGLVADAGAEVQGSDADAGETWDNPCGAKQTYPWASSQCVGKTGCWETGVILPCADTCTRCSGPVCVEVVSDSEGCHPHPEWLDCAQDDDCVPVETECCDHCNGGMIVAVHKDYALQMTPAGCTGVSCTEKACQAATAECVEGKCGIVYPTPPCTKTPPGRVCVRGNPVEDGEQIAVGDPVKVTVFPQGCFSSACTDKDVAKCSVLPDAGNATVIAEFCLKNTTGPGGCTADCGGGGFAECASGVWTAGAHKVSLGGLHVEVTVPSKLPFGGSCAGSPM